MNEREAPPLTMDYGRRLSLQKKLAFSLVAFLMFFLLAEGAARLLDRNAKDVSGNQGRQMFLSTFEAQDSRHYVPDGKLFWRLKPAEKGISGLPVNSRGLRGQEFSQTKPRGTYRIIVMGDSCTFGIGVNNEKETFPRQMEQMLRSRGIPAEVVNAGVPGYSSYQGRILLKDELLDCDPDVVLIRFGLNDYLYAESAGDKNIPHHSPLISRVYGILRYSHFFRLWESLLGRLQNSAQTGAPSLDRRVSPEDFEDNLREMARLIQSRGAKVVFMNNPLRKRIPLVWNARPVFSRKGDKSERRWTWIGNINQPGFLENPTYPGPISDIKAGLKAWPDWAILHYFLAQKYEEAGLHEEADLEYKKAIELDVDRATVQQYNRIVGKVARQENVGFVDLEAEFDKSATQDYFCDERHQTSLGSALVARLAADEALRSSFASKSQAP